MEYHHFIGDLSSRRQQSITRMLGRVYYSGPRDVIPLFSGMPNPAMFPFAEAKFEMADGARIELKVQSLFVSEDVDFAYLMLTLRGT